MASLFTEGKFQAFDADGNPLASGKLYSYAAGTLTPLATYTTQAGNVANANPVILDSAGRASVWLGESTYRVILKTAADVTIYDVDNIEGDLSGDGASAIGYTPPGTGAVARTVESKLGESISIKDFGAACNGSTDDSAAIALAVTYCKTLQSPTLIVGPGDVYIGNTTATFDVPDGTRLVFSGRILSTASGKSAVVIGKDSANTSFVRIDGFQAVRSTNDTSGGSVGVELLNLIAATGDIKACYGFNTGIKAHGNGYGFAYNTITLGAIRDNQTNIRLAATAGAGNGYCNENTFIGGTFNHSSGYPSVATVNIQIDDYTSVLNNNVFIRPSLEDNNALAVAAVINGENNFLLWPRLERSVDQATYEIQFTVDSLRCGVIGNGFGLSQSNFDDLGSTNEWESTEGTRVQRGTPDTSGKGVIRARSTNTSSARVLLIEDASGTETATIRGDGRVTVPTVRSYRVAGGSTSYANDAAAAAGGVEVGGFYRNGSVVQVRVA